MEKVLAVLLSTLALTVSAKETITAAYSWTAADNAANFYRALTEEANKQQTQYIFLFEPTPRAGGTVAANYTANTPTTTLWLNSLIGYTQPNLCPTESHSLISGRVK